MIKKKRKKGEEKLTLPTTQKYEIARLALQASNDDLQSRAEKMHFNAQRLKREITNLTRHINDFSSPLLETWEADILTRLIEIAHVRQLSKMPEGVAIRENTVSERDLISKAYCNAARRVKATTLFKFGLDQSHYEALQRYPEVS